VGLAEEEGGGGGGGRVWNTLPATGHLTTKFINKSLQNQSLPKLENKELS